MKRVAVYVCGQVSKTCVGTGCLKAYNKKSDSFERYGEEEVELVAFNHCNACEIPFDEEIEIKIEKMKKYEIDTVHISTCIRGRCEHYEEMVNKFSQHFDVIGYTHGSKEGKQKNNINIVKDKDGYKVVEPCPW